MKKLNNLKWFTLGIAVCLLVSLLVVPALASNMDKQATLNYRDIKITLDGTALVPKDASGNVVEPFVIDGTTYLPIRAVAGALGLGVDWDGTTSTVKLASPGKTPADAAGTVLMDKNGIKISYVGIETSSSSSRTEVKLLIENSTDKAYVVQSRDCSINGFMASPVFSPTVAAGKKANNSLTFYESSLSGNGITAIETVELYFTVFEADDWSNGFDSDIVTINCK